MNRFLLIALPALFAATGCAASEDPSSEDEPSAVAESDLTKYGGLGADGDACTVRIKDGTKVPGTEKDGECCATADPTDCVIILKPFPRASFSTRF